MSSKAPRGQRLVEHHAATTTDPRLKRLLGPRSLEDVSPAFNRFLLNAAPITTTQDAEKRNQQLAGNAVGETAAWIPSAELIRNVKSNPDAEEEFHSMKLSRVLCKTISNEVEKKVQIPETVDEDHIPTRVSRVVVPASVQQKKQHDDDEDEEEEEGELLIHSCAAVLASKILCAKSMGNVTLVWIVENNNAREEVENVLEAVFGVNTSSFVVVSAAARTAVDLTKTSILSSVSSGKSPKSKQHEQVPVKKNLFVVTTTSSSGTNVNRALSETVLSATNTKQFSTLQILIFGQSEQTIKSIEVGLSTPRIVSVDGENAKSNNTTTTTVALDTTTPRKLYYAVADGFGNFFAICRLIQNLTRGQRVVIHFATRHSALFFVDAFYALQNKSDSLLGQAANLTIICDAESVPKRVEAAGTGMDYQEMLSKHVAAAAKRFTNLKEDRTGIYISGFGVVPELTAKTTANGSLPGIFVQAESLPDVALATTSLFLAPASPLNDPKQYKTNILFVAPTEVKAGLVSAIEEILATTHVAASGARRGRNQNENQTASSPSLWSVAQLPLSTILRGTTDKNTSLNQILEAREFQSLVRKIFALNSSAYEAFRSYCLFYQTMCFGYHLDESVAALRKITGSAKFGLGPKTAQWYEHCQKTAIDAAAFAAFLNLEGQAHRFGLETPPLLDLRTKDTEFRPRRDLYRFAVTAKTLQARDYKIYADEHLQPEKEDSDEGW